MPGMYDYYSWVSSMFAFVRGGIVLRLFWLNADDMVNIALDSRIDTSVAIPNTNVSTAMLPSMVEKIS